jgi:hypothetical protein
MTIEYPHHFVISRKYYTNNIKMKKTNILHFIITIIIY